MGPLSRWAVRRPWWALGAWLILVVVVFGLGGKFGGTLNDSFTLPNTESLTAQNLLEEMPRAQASAATSATANIVWSPSTGTALDANTDATVVPLLTKISTLPGVACVSNPFSSTGQGLGSECPKAGAPVIPTGLPAAQEAALKASLVASAKAVSPVSADGTVAKSTVTFSGNSTGTDVPKATATEILALSKAAGATPGLKLGANGQVLENAGASPPSSESIGVLVALIILLIAFGSFLAALLPLITAIFGVALGASLLLFVAKFMDVATFAPTLAAMIGLGVGIDYSLFVINRFRQAVMGGKSAKDAAYESVGTSGRAVVFAATTVIIALLGLFVMRISFFNGLSLAAAGTVLLVMLSAVWLLPALLSLLGDRAVAPLSRTLHIKPLYRLTRHSRHQADWHPDSNRWADYGRLLQRRPIVPLLLSLGVVLVLAIPVFSLRLGFPDDSGQPQGSLARTAYDLSAKGFGPGSNGPFFVAVKLPTKGDTAGLAATVKALEGTAGVARTVPNTAMVPLVAAGLADQTITAIQVVPTTGPQEAATTDLLNTLRNDTLPTVDAVTGAKSYVGGQTAVVADFSTVLTNALPLFLALVVGLGFLALLMLFRAALVSLTAVVTSLLSFAASMGITVAVFQWGWLDGLLGVSGTGPIFPFLPVMVFSILFGLSMDYQVFLVSRMQEEWAVTKDNSLAVRRGLGGSGRVVLMAALIMGSVFAAFIPTPVDTIKLFGVALTSAVLVDAFLIRLVFVPSLMTMLGKSNWWLPGWLNRVLPHMSVEDSNAAHESVPTPTDEVSDPNLEASTR